MQEAQATFGKTISPAMASTLLSICDDYGLPVEVVVMLIHYAKDAGKTGTAYIDSVARDWAESGVFTLEAAEQKLQELEERRLAWSKVQSAAGLPRRRPPKRRRRPPSGGCVSGNLPGKCSPPRTSAAWTTRESLT